MQSYLAAGIGIAELAALTCLMRRRLIRSHRALACYLVANAATACWLWGLDLASAEYMRRWATTLPVLTALKVWMGIQAYGRSLELFPAVKRLSHMALLMLCVCAAVGAQVLQTTHTAYGLASRVDQGVAFALGVFVFCMIPLLNAFYSPRRRPNAVVQEWLLLIHYLGVALAILATHWQAYWVALAISVSTTLAACAGWGMLLTRAGEVLPPAPTATGAERWEKVKAERQMAGIVASLRSMGSSKRDNNP